MMIASRHLLLILAVAACLTACTEHAADTPDADASVGVDVETPVPAAPSATELLARAKEAAEAFNQGDGDYFEGLLSDRFVMQRDGRRVTKSDLVKIINGQTCEARPGWTFTEPQMLQINDDAYVLSYASDMDATCIVDGVTVNMPSPARVSTLWIRNDDNSKWEVAFQAQNRIVDLSAPQETAGKPAPTPAGTPHADVNIAATSPPATPSTDAITTALMAAETAIWDAWKDKNASRITALTADEITFVDLFGFYTDNKADTVKSWTGPACNVTGVTLTDGVGTSVSPVIGILTLTGKVTGECGGQDISGQIIRANTVYVKEGDAWKWVFGFNSPA